MRGARFHKLRWIVAGLAILLVSTAAVSWWRGRLADRARAAWMKTLQDAGFQTGETEGIIALPFDLTIPASLSLMDPFGAPGTMPAPVPLEDPGLEPVRSNIVDVKSPGCAGASKPPNGLRVSVMAPGLTRDDLTQLSDENEMG